MPRPTDIAQKATRESRAKGGRVRAERIAAEKAKQRRLAVERGMELVHSALDKVEEALDGGDPRLALVASRDILDRFLGKQMGDAQSGPVDVKLAFNPRPRPDLSKLTDRERATLRRLAKKLSDAGSDLGLGDDDGRWIPWATEKDLDTLEEIRNRAEARRERGGGPPIERTEPEAAKPGTKRKPGTTPAASSPRPARRKRPAKPTPARPPEPVEEQPAERPARPAREPAVAKRGEERRQDVREKAKREREERERVGPPQISGGLMGRTF